MASADTIDRSSTRFARGCLVLEGALELGLGLLAALFAWNLSGRPACPLYSDCLFDAHAALPQIAGFAAVTLTLGLSTVIGAAKMRRRCGAAWWLALASQLATLVAIIVPVALDPYEIGWAFLAVFPLIGLGIVLSIGWHRSREG